MTGRADRFDVTFTTSGGHISARVNPPDEALDVFLNHEIALPVMRETLVARANDARAGHMSNYGSNAYAIDFELDGVVLEHQYLDGEPSVKVDLDNFIGIITAYSRIQQQAVQPSDPPHRSER